MRSAAKTDRRAFLKRAGGVAAAPVLGAASRLFAVADGSAELVCENGVIVTMDEKQPFAQALAVRNGRITAVGDDQAVRKLVSGDTKVIDLGGKCVSPGLIDAHSHVMGYGQMQLKYVLLRPPKINSFRTLNAALAKAAKDIPKGEWIVGRGFSRFKEDRFPRRWELDEAVPDHPTLIIHWGGQFGAANTLAMKKANLLSRDVKDPYGGKYLRDRRTGVPDGVLLHYPAIYSVHQPMLDEREQVECAEWGMKQLAEQGVTCVHDNFCHPQFARTYVRLERMDRLACRVRVYPYIKTLEHCRMLAERLRRYEGPLVRMQGIKLAVDGYALMYDVPKEHRHMAIPMHPQPKFNEIIATIHKAGLQADVHAVGDKGVDWTLGAFAKATGSAAECRRRRHRIEHFPFLKLDSIKRAADLGVPVCLQPNFIEVKADDMASKFGRSRRKLVDALLPIQTFVKEGVQLAYGADVPAFPSHRPMDSIRSAMERKAESGRKLDRDEAVTFLEALRHHTIGSAFIAFDEKELGSLEVGKQADFVIWSKDLRKVRTGRQAAALEPRATYLAGEAVYEAS